MENEKQTLARMAGWWIIPETDDSNNIRFVYANLRAYQIEKNFMCTSNKCLLKVNRLRGPSCFLPVCYHLGVLEG